MESLIALGLASNIIQIVDFSSRIISRGRELYDSADGRIEEHVVLDNAARNLSELYNDLHATGQFLDPRELTVADKQLIELKHESEDVVHDLLIIQQWIISGIVSLQKCYVKSRQEARRRCKA
jgi:hypothetical protein